VASACRSRGIAPVVDQQRGGCAPKLARYPASAARHFDSSTRRDQRPKTTPPRRLRDRAAKLTASRLVADDRTRLGTPAWMICPWLPPSGDPLHDLRMRRLATSCEPRRCRAAGTRCGSAPDASHGRVCTTTGPLGEQTCQHLTLSLLPLANSVFFDRPEIVDLVEAWSTPPPTRCEIHKGATTACAQPADPGSLGYQWATPARWYPRRYWVGKPSLAHAASRR